jgi:hypothetical protein
MSGLITLLSFGSGNYVNRANIGHLVLWGIGVVDASEEAIEGNLPLLGVLRTLATPYAGHRADALLDFEALWRTA